MAIFLGCCENSPSAGRTFIVSGHVYITCITHYPSTPQHSCTDSGGCCYPSTDISTVPIVVVDDYLNALEQDEADTDEEDEFFDVMEYNNLPNLVVHDGLASPSTSPILSMPISAYIKMELYTGYENLRTKLKLSDERPSGRC